MCLLRQSTHEVRTQYFAVNSQTLQGCWKKEFKQCKLNVTFAHDLWNQLCFYTHTFFKNSYLRLFLFRCYAKPVHLDKRHAMSFFALESFKARSTTSSKHFRVFWSPAISSCVLCTSSSVLLKAIRCATICFCSPVCNAYLGISWSTDDFTSFNRRTVSSLLWVCHSLIDNYLRDIQEFCHNFCYNQLVHTETSFY